MDADNGQARPETRRKQSDTQLELLCVNCNGLLSGDGGYLVFPLKAKAVNSLFFFFCSPFLLWVRVSRTLEVRVSRTFRKVFHSRSNCQYSTPCQVTAYS
jgi:hypothetical protein